jgi:RNA polymerase sigma factor (TIGR02999 family)
MADVTLILSRIEHGDPQAADKLLPLVYDELRKLAAAKLANEKPGQTLQATALVHDAYIRLVDVEQAQQWDSRGHFFAAAAEAMRRILVESARRKARLKHGGGYQRQAVDDIEEPATTDGLDLIAVSDALDELEETDSVAASLVKLRYFAGMSVEQATQSLGMSARTGYYTWDYARSWLRCRLQPEE